MKDAKGHGSNLFGQRGGGTFGRNGISIASNADFNRTGQSLAQETAERSARAEEDRQNTVSRLRSQFRDAGPGHSTGLAQGLKHFLGR